MADDILAAFDDVAGSARPVDVYFGGFDRVVTFAGSTVEIARVLQSQDPVWDRRDDLVRAANARIEKAWQQVEPAFHSYRAPLETLKADWTLKLDKLLEMTRPLRPKMLQFPASWIDIGFGMFCERVAMLQSDSSNLPHVLPVALYGVECLSMGAPADSKEETHSSQVVIETGTQWKQALESANRAGKVLLAEHPDLVTALLKKGVSAAVGISCALQCVLVRLELACGAGTAPFPVKLALVVHTGGSEVKISRVNNTV